MALTPAIFLDKDGTVLRDVPYNVDPEKMMFAPGAREGIGVLGTLGLPLIVITNQPGIALGRFDMPAFIAMQGHLARMFDGAGGRLSGVYFCPHYPQGSHEPYARTCACRKPAPGLLLRAAREHHIDLTQSWMVGDILDDVEAGRRAGCRSVLIDNGNENQWYVNAWRRPDRIEPDLHRAALFLAQCLCEPEARRHA